jgi:hypothetical protein
MGYVYFVFFLPLMGLLCLSLLSLLLMDIIMALRAVLARIFPYPVFSWALFHIYNSASLTSSRTYGAVHLATA